MIYKKGKPTPDAKKISFSPLLTLLKQTRECINVSGSATMTTPSFPGLQLSSWKYFLLQKKVLILLWYLKVLYHEIYQNSKSGKRHQIEWNIKITAQNPAEWVCAAGLSEPILWPIIDPILVTFGQICNFRDPNLVTFYFYELTHFLDWMKNTLLFICSTNILVRLLFVNMENFLTPKNPKMCYPILFNPVLKMGPHPAAHSH